MPPILFAHSHDTLPPEQWHSLEAHLCDTATLAATFASNFKAQDWAYLAGLWHDLGKGSAEFQQRLQGDPKPVDHATAGAKFALEQIPSSFGELKFPQSLGKLLAYCLAGHHGGLLDGPDLDARLQTTPFAFDLPSYATPPELDRFKNAKTKAALFPLGFDYKQDLGFQLSFFVRMVFSALVDADWLDTEGFMQPAIRAQRRVEYNMAALLTKLNHHLEQKTAQSQPSKVNQIRAQVLAECRAKAALEPGLFSLTVPTGGGKTLSSLAFALEHAVRHHKQRVIYVIPYTSIIEQNARVFREVLGDSAVVEHHSNFDPNKFKKDENVPQFARLAAENWDAPVVVTTNVQFFESLFAAKGTRCRKLHNIANSVVILDEAQMLPTKLLMPCLAAIRELATRYGVTLVLCTATQPVLGKRDGFKGLENVREIMSNPKELAKKLERVQAHVLGELEDDALAARLKLENQALCIVNSRKQARELFAKLETPGFHLSALMFPQHRTQVLQRIRQALQEKQPCLVVSTQLVEAGVDLDFPAVYRALAGLDSLAQAAGRCNREGLLDQGRVYFFIPSPRNSKGDILKAGQAAESVLLKHNNPLSMETIEAYFLEFLWRKSGELGENFLKGIEESGVAKFNFAFQRNADQFNIIEQEQAAIVVPYICNHDGVGALDPDVQARVAELRKAKYPRQSLRALQSHVVQVEPGVLTHLQEQGAVEPLYPGKDLGWLLREKSFYHHQLGLQTQGGALVV